MFLLLVVAIVGGVVYGMSHFSNNEKVQRTVSERYTTNDVIYSYPNDSESQVLSESLGLYLEFLVDENDSVNFQKNFEQLRDKFIIEKEGLLYIQWVINEGTVVNALIDDVRIISALQKASKVFDKRKYGTLADDLVKSIGEVQQQNGIIVDFYDWEHEQAANRITLSYLTPDFFDLITPIAENKKLLLEATGVSVFFPEYYDTNQGEYVESEEVHLVDQLLIALNRTELGQTSPTFEKWVKAEWESTGKLRGRYYRTTKKSSVSYESAAVYYYLYEYFSAIEAYELAKEVRSRTIEIMEENVLNNAHFFDYLHYEKFK